MRNFITKYKPSSYSNNNLVNNKSNTVYTKSNTVNTKSDSMIGNIVIGWHLVVFSIIIVIFAFGISNYHFKKSIKSTKAKSIHHTKAKNVFNIIGWVFTGVHIFLVLLLVYFYYNLEFRIN
jgi:uncharacterized membrane protein